MKCVAKGHKKLWFMHFTFYNCFCNLSYLFFEKYVSGSIKEYFLGNTASTYCESNVGFNIVKITLW